MLLVHSLTFFIFFLKSLKVTQFLVESENCKVDFEKKKKKKEKKKSSILFVHINIIPYNMIYVLYFEDGSSFCSVASATIHVGMWTRVQDWTCIRI